jgi:hypothetical protein
VAGVWGPIVSAVALREAIRSTLQLWLPSTVAEVARQAGVDPATILPVRSWHVVSFEQAREDQLPAVFVTSPGLAGEPRRRGTGLITADWNATVVVLARAESHEATAKLVSLYTAAARVVCVQRSGFGGFAAACEWTGEDYDVVEDRKGRTLGGGFVDLVVTVSNVVDANGGPLEPPADPLTPAGDWPVVATTRTDVIHVPPDQELP